MQYVDTVVCCLKPRSRIIRLSGNFYTYGIGLGRSGPCLAPMTFEQESIFVVVPDKLSRAFSQIYPVIAKSHHFFFTRDRTAAVAMWVRGLALQAEGWAFESQPRQT